MSQLAVMREMLAAFSGNELILGVILGNWLVLTGLGAWLGRKSSPRPGSCGTFIAGQVLIALVPLLQVVALRALWSSVFLRGAVVGVTESVLSSLLLLLPYCAVSGYLLTSACGLLAATEGAGAIGGVYAADSLGSIGGGVAFSFLLLGVFDHFGLLLFPAVANLGLAGLMAWRCKKLAWLSAAVILIVGLVILGNSVDVDEVLTARQYNGQQLLFRGNSHYGRLVTTQSAGQINLFENGLPLASSHQVEQAEETVHYAMAQRPDAREVLLISAGLSGVTSEILKYPVQRLTYVALDPLIVTAGRKYLPSNVTDPRIQVVNTDGRLFIKRTTQRFGVIIIDVPEPSTFQLNRFYTAEFFGEVKRVLAKGGVVSFALGRYENYVSQELARMLASAHHTLKTAFSNVLAIPGGRVFFLASDSELNLEIFTTLQQRHIQTRWVHRHYLEATLTADRVDDVRRATMQPAAINTDFNPVLYTYHLAHWMSQFRTRSAWWAGFLLVLAAVYAARLNRVQWAVFASGFAGSALELVLLLGFQILYGVLYYQMAIIITCFMTGLAGGALWANRASAGSGRRQLALLCLLIGLGAALLPVVLHGLAMVNRTTAMPSQLQYTVPVLTLFLAMLIGLQFPLASRLGGRRYPAEESASHLTTSRTAARLYTADFVGACLGALLTCTLLIPLAGVTAVCLLVAGLNILAAIIVGWGKPVT